MRVMVLVKANSDTEAGVLPTSEQLAEMGEYNEALVNASIMLAGEGLRDSSHGARVRFGGADGPVVIDGPFTEAKELIAGFWIWQVSSFDEAVDWLKRAPFPEGEVELRRIFEAEDFGDNLTPELQEREAALRARAETS